ncbi:titin-like, partial [Harmonia axyridis]|uniref:titin-like n=1 Tax=Harmonia axyridis TaxID=115357 RepID=UPI001E278590
MSHSNKNLCDEFKVKSDDTISPFDNISSDIKFEENQVQFIPVRLQNESQSIKHTRRLKFRIGRKVVEKSNSEEKNCCFGLPQKPISELENSTINHISTYSKGDTDCSNDDENIACSKFYPKTKHEKIGTAHSENQEQNDETAFDHLSVSGNFQDFIRNEEEHTSKSIYITATYVYNMQQSFNVTEHRDGENCSNSGMEFRFRQNKAVGTVQTEHKETKNYSRKMRISLKKEDRDNSMYPFHFLERETSDNLHFDGPFVDSTPPKRGKLNENVIKTESKSSKAINTTGSCPKRASICDNSLKRRSGHENVSLSREIDHESTYISSKSLRSMGRINRNISKRFSNEDLATANEEYKVNIQGSKKKKELKTLTDKYFVLKKGEMNCHQSFTKRDCCRSRFGSKTIDQSRSSDNLFHHLPFQSKLSELMNFEKSSDKCQCKPLRIKKDKEIFVIHRYISKRKMYIPDKTSAVDIRLKEKKITELKVYKEVPTHTSTIPIRNVASTTNTCKDNSRNKYKNPFELLKEKELSNDEFSIEKVMFVPLKILEEPKVHKPDKIKKSEINTDQCAKVNSKETSKPLHASLTTSNQEVNISLNKVQGVAKYPTSREFLEHITKECHKKKYKKTDISPEEENTKQDKIPCRCLKNEESKKIDTTKTGSESSELQDRRISEKKSENSSPSAKQFLDELEKMCAEKICICEAKDENNRREEVKVDETEIDSNNLLANIPIFKTDEERAKEGKLIIYKQNESSQPSLGDSRSSEDSRKPSLKIIIEGLPYVEDLIPDDINYEFERSELEKISTLEPKEELDNQNESRKYEEATIDSLLPSFGILTLEISSEKQDTIEKKSDKSSPSTKRFLDKLEKICAEKICKCEAKDENKRKEKVEVDKTEIDNNNLLANKPKFKPDEEKAQGRKPSLKIVIEGLPYVEDLIPDDINYEFERSELEKISMLKPKEELNNKDGSRKDKEATIDSVLPSFGIPTLEISRVKQDTIEKKSDKSSPSTKQFIDKLEKICAEKICICEAKDENKRKEKVQVDETEIENNNILAIIPILKPDEPDEAKDENKRKEKVRVDETKIDSSNLLAIIPILKPDEEKAQEGKPSLKIVIEGLPYVEDFTPDDENYEFERSELEKISTLKSKKELDNQEGSRKDIEATIDSLPSFETPTLEILSEKQDTIEKKLEKSSPSSKQFLDKLEKIYAEKICKCEVKDENKRREKVKVDEPKIDISNLLAIIPILKPDEAKDENRKEKVRVDETKVDSSNLLAIIPILKPDEEKAQEGKPSLKIVIKGLPYVEDLTPDDKNYEFERSELEKISTLKSKEELDNQEESRKDIEATIDSLPSFEIPSFEIPSEKQDTIDAHRADDEVVERTESKIGDKNEEIDRRQNEKEIGGEEVPTKQTEISSRSDLTEDEDKFSSLGELRKDKYIKLSDEERKQKTSDEEENLDTQELEMEKQYQIDGKDISTIAHETQEESSKKDVTLAGLQLEGTKQIKSDGEDDMDKNQMAENDEEHKAEEGEILRGASETSTQAENIKKRKISFAVGEEYKKPVDEDKTVGENILTKLVESPILDIGDMKSKISNEEQKIATERDENFGKDSESGAKDISRVSPETSVGPDSLSLEVEVVTQKISGERKQVGKEAMRKEISIEAPEPSLELNRKISRKQVDKDKEKEILLKSPKSSSQLTDQEYVSQKPLGPIKGEDVIDNNKIHLEFLELKDSDKQRDIETTKVDKGEIQGTIELLIRQCTEREKEKHGPKQYSPLLDIKEKKDTKLIEQKGDQMETKDEIKKPSLLSVTELSTDASKISTKPSLTHELDEDQGATQRIGDGKEKIDEKHLDKRQYDSESEYVPLKAPEISTKLKLAEKDGKLSRLEDLDIEKKHVDERKEIDKKLIDEIKDQYDANGNIIPTEALDTPTQPKSTEKEDEFSRPEYQDAERKRGDSVEEIDRKQSDRDKAPYGSEKIDISIEAPEIKSQPRSTETKDKFSGLGYPDAEQEIGDKREEIAKKQLDEGQKDSEMKDISTKAPDISIKPISAEKDDKYSRLEDQDSEQEHVDNKEEMDKKVIAKNEDQYEIIPRSVLDTPTQPKLAEKEDELSRPEDQDAERKIGDSVGEIDKKQFDEVQDDAEMNKISTIAPYVSIKSRLAEKEDGFSRLEVQDDGQKIGYKGKEMDRKELVKDEGQIKKEKQKYKPEEKGKIHLENIKGKDLIEGLEAHVEILKLKDPNRERTGNKNQDDKVEFQNAVEGGDELLIRKMAQVKMETHKRDYTTDKWDGQKDTEQVGKSRIYRDRYDRTKKYPPLGESVSKENLYVEKSNVQPEGKDEFKRQIIEDTKDKFGLEKEKLDRDRDQESEEGEIKKGEIGGTTDKKADFERKQKKEERKLDQKKDQKELEKSGKIPETRGFSVGEIEMKRDRDGELDIDHVQESDKQKKVTGKDDMKRREIGDTKEEKDDFDREKKEEESQIDRAKYQEELKKRDEIDTTGGIAAETIEMKIDIKDELDEERVQEFDKRKEVARKDETKIQEFDDNKDKNEDLDRMEEKRQLDRKISQEELEKRVEIDSTEGIPDEKMENQKDREGELDKDIVQGADQQIDVTAMDEIKSREIGDTNEKKDSFDQEKKESQLDRMKEQEELKKRDEITKTGGITEEGIEMKRDKEGTFDKDRVQEPDKQIDVTGEVERGIGDTKDEKAVFDRQKREEEKQLLRKEEQVEPKKTEKITKTGGIPDKKIEMKKEREGELDKYRDQKSDTMDKILQGEFGRLNLYVYKTNGRKIQTEEGGEIKKADFDKNQKEKQLDRNKDQEELNKGVGEIKSGDIPGRRTEMKKDGEVKLDKNRVQESDTKDKIMQGEFGRLNIYVYKKNERKNQKEEVIKFPEDNIDRKQKEGKQQPDRTKDQEKSTKRDETLERGGISGEEIEVNKEREVPVQESDQQRDVQRKDEIKSREIGGTKDGEADIHRQKEDEEKLLDRRKDPEDLEKGDEITKTPSISDEKIELKRDGEGKIDTDHAQEPDKQKEVTGKDEIKIQKIGDTKDERGESPRERKEEEEQLDREKDQEELEKKDKMLETGSVSVEKIGMKKDEEYKLDREQGQKSEEKKGITEKIDDTHDKKYESYREQKEEGRQLDRKEDHEELEKKETILETGGFSVAEIEMKKDGEGVLDKERVQESEKKKGITEKDQIKSQEIGDTKAKKDDFDRDKKEEERQLDRKKDQEELEKKDKILGTEGIPVGKMEIEKDKEGKLDRERVQESEEKKEVEEKDEIKSQEIGDTKDKIDESDRGYMEEKIQLDRKKDELLETKIISVPKIEMKEDEKGELDEVRVQESEEEKVTGEKDIQSQKIGDTKDEKDESDRKKEEEKRQLVRKKDKEEIEKKDKILETGRISVVKIDMKKDGEGKLDQDLVQESEGKKEITGKDEIKGLNDTKDEKYESDHEKKEEERQLDRKKEQEIQKDGEGKIEKDRIWESDKKEVIRKDEIKSQEFRDTNETKEFLDREKKDRHLDPTKDMAELKKKDEITKTEGIIDKEIETKKDKEGTLDKERDQESDKQIYVSGEDESAIGDTKDKVAVFDGQKREDEKQLVRKKEQEESIKREKITKTEGDPDRNIDMKKEREGKVDKYQVQESDIKNKMTQGEFGRLNIYVYKKNERKIQIKEGVEIPTDDIGKKQKEGEKQLDRSKHQKEIKKEKEKIESGGIPSRKIEDKKGKLDIYQVQESDTRDKMTQGEFGRLNIYVYKKNEEKTKYEEKVKISKEDNERKQKEEEKQLDRKTDEESKKRDEMPESMDILDRKIDLKKDREGEPFEVRVNETDQKRDDLKQDEIKSREIAETKDWEVDIDRQKEDEEKLLSQKKGQEELKEGDEITKTGGIPGEKLEMKKEREGELDTGLAQEPDKHKEVTEKDEIESQKIVDTEDARDESDREKKEKERQLDRKEDRAKLDKGDILMETVGIPVEKIEMKKDGEGELDKDRVRESEGKQELTEKHEIITQELGDTKDKKDFDRGKMEEERQLDRKKDQEELKTKDKILETGDISVGKLDIKKDGEGKLDKDRLQEIEEKKQVTGKDEMRSREIGDTKDKKDDFDRDIMEEERQQDRKQYQEELEKKDKMLKTEGIPVEKLEIKKDGEGKLDKDRVQEIEEKKLVTGKDEIKRREIGETKDEKDDSKRDKMEEERPLDREKDLKELKKEDKILESGDIPVGKLEIKKDGEGKLDKDRVQEIEEKKQVTGKEGIKSREIGDTKAKKDDLGRDKKEEERQLDRKKDREELERKDKMLETGSKLEIKKYGEGKPGKDLVPETEKKKQLTGKDEIKSREIDDTKAKKDDLGRDKKEEERQLDRKKDQEELGKKDKMLETGGIPVGKLEIRKDGEDKPGKDLVPETEKNKEVTEKDEIKSRDIGDTKAKKDALDRDKKEEERQLDRKKDQEELEKKDKMLEAGSKLEMKKDGQGKLEKDRVQEIEEKKQVTGKDEIKSREIGDTKAKKDDFDRDKKEEERQLDRKKDQEELGKKDKMLETGGIPVGKLEIKKDGEGKPGEDLVPETEKKKEVTGKDEIKSREIGDTKAKKDDLGRDKKEEERQLDRKKDQEELEKKDKMLEAGSKLEMKKDGQGKLEKDRVQEIEEKKQVTGKDEIKSREIGDIKAKKDDFGRDKKEEERQLDRKKDQEEFGKKDKMLETGGVPVEKLEIKKDGEGKPGKDLVPETEKKKEVTGKDESKSREIDDTKAKKDDLDRDIMEEERKLDRRKDQEELGKRDKMLETGGIRVGKFEIKKDGEGKLEKDRVQEIEEKKKVTGKDEIKRQEIGDTKAKKDDMGRDKKEEERQLDRKEDQEELKKKDEILETGGIPVGKMEIEKGGGGKLDKDRVQKIEEKNQVTLKDEIKNREIGDTKDKKEKDERMLVKKKEQEKPKKREETTKAGDFPGGSEAQKDRGSKLAEYQVQDSHTKDEMTRGEFGRLNIYVYKKNDRKDRNEIIGIKMHLKDTDQERRNDMELGKIEGKYETNYQKYQIRKPEIEKDRKVEPDKRQVQESDKQKGDTGKDAIKDLKIDATKEKKAALDRKLKDEEKQLDRKKDQEGLKEREDITKTAGIPGGKIDMKEDRKIEPDKRQVQESDKQKGETEKDAIKGPKIDTTEEKKADLDRELKDEEKPLDRKKDQEGLKEREEITKTAGIPGGKIDMKEDRKVEPDKRQVQESDKQKGDTGKDSIKGPKIDATKEKTADLDRKLKDEEKQLDRKKDQEGLKEREEITKTTGIPGGKIDMKEDRKVEPDKRQVQESDKQKGYTGKDAIKGPKIDATEEKEADLDRKLKDEEKQLDRKKDQEGLKEREEITKTAGIPGGKIDMKEDRRVEPDKRQVQESDKQKGDTGEDAIKGPKIDATKEKEADLDRKLKDEEKQLDRKKDQEGLKEREEITKTAGIPGGKIDMKEDRKVEPDKRQVQESDKQKEDTGKDAIKGPKIDATKEKKGDLDRKLKDEEKQLDREKDQEGLKEREEITKTTGIPGGKIDMKEDRKVEPDKRQVQESDKQKGYTGKDAIKGPEIDATKEREADLDRKLKDEEKQLDRKKDQEGLKEREEITKTAGIPGGKIDMKEDRKVEPDKRQVQESDKQKGDTGKDAIKGPKIDATKEKKGDLDRKLKDEEKQLDREKDQEGLKEREEITKTTGIPGGKIDMKEDRRVEPDKRQVQESDKQKGDTGEDAIKGPKIDATKEKKADLDRKLKDEEKQLDRKKDQEGLKEREEITKTAGIPGGKIDMKEDRRVEPDKRQVQESDKQKGDTGEDAIEGPKIDATKEKKADLDRKLKDEEKQLDRKKDQEGLKEREEITKTAGIPGGKIDMKEDKKVEPDKRQVQESDKQKGDTGKDAIKVPKIDATKEKKADLDRKLKDEEKQLDRKKDQEGIKEKEEITKTAGIPDGKIDMKEDRKVEPDKRQVQESDKQKGDTGKDAIKGPKIDATQEKKGDLDRKLKDEEKQLDRKKDQERLKKREEITKTAGIPGGKIDMKEDKKVEPDKRQVQESDKQKGDTGKDAIKGPKIDATKEKKGDLDRKLKDEEKQLDRKKDQEGLKEREDITKTAGIPGGKIDMKEDRKLEPDKRQVQESDKQKGDTGKDAIKGPKIDATKEKRADLDRKLKDEEKQLDRKKDQEGLKEREEITKTAGIPGGKIDMKEDRKVEPDKRQVQESDKQKGDTGKDAIKGPKIDATKEKKADLDRKLKDEEKQLDRKDQEGLKEREEITKTAGIPGGKIDMKEDRRVEPDKRQVQESDKQKGDTGEDAIKGPKIDATKEKKADLDRKLKDEEKQLDLKKDQDGLKEREDITKTAGIPGGKIDMKEDRKFETDKRQVQESDKQKGDTGKDAIKGPKIDATKEKKADLDRKLKDEEKQLDRKKDQEGLKEREDITKTAGIPGGKIDMKQDRKVEPDKRQVRESDKQKGDTGKDAIKGPKIDATKEKKADLDRKLKDEEKQLDRKKDQEGLKEREDITKTAGIPGGKIDMKEDRKVEPDKRQVQESDKQKGDTGKDAIKGPKIDATKEKKGDLDRKLKDEEKQLDRKKDQEGLKEREEITKTAGIPGGKIDMKEDRKVEPDKRQVQESDKQKGDTEKDAIKGPKIGATKEKKGDLDRKLKDEEKQLDRKKDQDGLKEREDITKTAGIPGGKIDMKEDRKVEPDKRQVQESDKQKGDTGKDAIKGPKIDATKEKKADLDRKLKDEEKQLDRIKDQGGLKKREEITKTAGIPGGKIDMKEDRKVEPDKRQVQESDKQKGDTGKDAIKGPKIDATKEKQGDIDRKLKDEEKQLDRKKDQERLKKREEITKTAGIPGGKIDMKEDRKVEPDKRQVQESDKQKGDTGKDAIKGPKIDATKEKQGDIDRKLKDEEKQLDRKKDQEGLKEREDITKTAGIPGGKIDMKEDRKVEPDKRQVQESDKQKGDTGKDAIKGPKIDATKEKKGDLDRKLKDEEKQLDRKKDQERLKEREDITKTAGIPGGKIDMKEDRRVEPDKRQVQESDKQKGDTGKDAIKGPKIDATKEKKADLDRKLKDEEKQLDRKKNQEGLKEREEITKTAGIPGGKIDMKEDRKVEPDKRQVQESDKQKGDTGKDAIKGPKIDATKEKKADLDRKLKDEEKQLDRKDQEGLKEREEITKTAGIPGGKIDMKEDRRVEPDKRQVQESDKQKGDTGEDAIKGPKIDATKEKKADLDRKLKDEEKQLDRKKDQDGLKEREDITKTAGIPGGKIDMKEDRKFETDKRQVQESD